MTIWMTIWGKKSDYQGKPYYCRAQQVPTEASVVNFARQQLNSSEITNNYYPRQVPSSQKKKQKKNGRFPNFVQKMLVTEKVTVIRVTVEEKG